MQVQVIRICKAEDFFDKLIAHHRDTLNDDEYNFYFDIQRIMLSIIEQPKRNSGFITCIYDNRFYINYDNVIFVL